MRAIQINIKNEEELKNLKKSDIFEMIRGHFNQFNQGIFVFSIENDKIDDIKITVHKGNYERVIRVLEEIANTGLEYFLSKLLEISRKGKKRVQYNGVIIEKK